MAWKASVLLLCFILGVFAQQRVQRSIIDDYSVESDTLVIVIGATTVLPTQITNSVSNSGILGGERDLILRANTGSVGRVFTCGVNSGAWNVATPNGASGVAETQYDGADNSATLNPTGLGGVDLTTSQVDSFKLTIETDITTTYIISVTDMNGATSTRNIPIPGAPGVSNDYYILFSDFTGNANFANVGSVVITIQGFDNVDTLVQIFALAAPSSTPPPAASQSPRPEEKDSWYRFDDEDDGKSPCGEEADENTVFLADNNIIYYYFYGFQRPYIYVSNPNNNGAAFLIPSIFACILAFFAL